MNENEAESAILALGTTRLLATSDRNGRFTRVAGPMAAAVGTLAEGLDILTAAAMELGSTRDFGSLRSAVLMFGEVTVYVGVLASGNLVYVLSASDQANLGLMLSRLRTLISCSSQ